MSDLIIHDELAEDLRRISEKEKRPVEDILRSMIAQYKTAEPAAAPVSATPDPLDDFWGAFDDDVPDISSTIRETLDTYYHDKYGDSHGNSH